MKRFFTMILTAIALGMAFGGCSKYDDSALWKSVNDLDERLTALEKSVAQMNGDKIGRASCRERVF